jgi:hypothetical protein
MMNEIAMWFGYFNMAFYVVVGFVLVSGWLCGVIYRKFIDQAKFVNVLMRLAKEDKS